MPSPRLQALQQQAEVAINAYLNYRIGGLDLNSLHEVSVDPGSLKGIALNVNLTDLLNLASTAAFGCSFLAASGAKVPPLTAAQLMSILQQSQQEMAPLKEFVTQNKAERGNALARAGLEELLKKRLADRKKKRAPGASEATPSKEVQAPETEQPEEEQVEEEQPEEEGGAPEEEAPVPGGGEIPPGTGQAPVSGQASTGDSDGDSEAGGDQENEGEGAPDESQMARDLAQDKRDEQGKDNDGGINIQKNIDEWKAMRDAWDKERMEKRRQKLGIDKPEEQQEAKRGLEEEKRAEGSGGEKKADLGGEKEEGEKSWEQRMLRALEMGPIPGNLYFFWLAVADMLSILVAEVFEFMASFGYVNLHAFIDLLPFKVAIPWGGVKLEFDELSWREWVAIGIIDLIAVLCILLELAVIVAVAKVIKDPSYLIEIGHANLVALFSQLHID